VCSPLNGLGSQHRRRQFFCKEVWPSVLAKVSHGTLPHCGAPPTNVVQALASDSVEVTGTVPAIEEYLRRASVFVVAAPHRRGTRIKIYEGRPWAKRRSPRPSGQKPGRYAWKRTLSWPTILSLCRCHCVVPTDEDLRCHFEAAAAATAQKYDWPVITRQFVEVLRETIRQASDSSARRGRPKNGTDQPLARRPTSASQQLQTAHNTQQKPEEIVSSILSAANTRTSKYHASDDTW